MANILSLIASKTDLNDVTFILPIRIDSEERLENVICLISYIETYFSTNIFVLEADKKPVLEPFLSEFSLTYKYVYDDKEYFHHTHYRNAMIKNVLTNIIVVCDSDIIVPQKQLLEALSNINGYCISFPYSNICLDVPYVIKNEFIQKLDIRILESNHDKFMLYYGFLCVGGVYIIDKSKYMEMGMENEFILGWGPEDAERIKRATILNYRINRTNGVIYHLAHSKKNSINDSYYIDNMKEYLNICSFSKSKLIKEIKKWHWL